MKQYIVVDDRFKIGQYLLGIAKSLMPVNKSVKIVSEAEITNLAISPTHNKPYNKKVQDTLKDKKSYAMGNVNEFFETF